jgi:hypothetical protein
MGLTTTVFGYYDRETREEEREGWGMCWEDWKRKQHISQNITLEPLASVEDSNETDIKQIWWDPVQGFVDMAISFLVPYNIRAISWPTRQLRSPSVGMFCFELRTTIRSRIIILLCASALWRMQLHKSERRQAVQTFHRPNCSLQAYA